MSVPAAIPTTIGVEGRLAADPALKRARNGRPFVRVAFEAEPAPQRDADGQFVRVSRVSCELVCFGQAARTLSRRFRMGDFLVASGRLDRSQEPVVFVARRLGHDAARTTYRVTRTTAAGHTSTAGRANAKTTTGAAQAPSPHRPVPDDPAAQAPVIDTNDGMPVVAGRILPDRAQTVWSKR